LPLVAALVALGLDALCARGQHLRALAFALVASWMLWSLASWLWIGTRPWQGIEGRARQERYGLMDIAEHQTLDTPFTVARIPASQLFAIGPDSCAPVTLYAHYALFVDQSFAIGTLDRCGDTGTIRLGGMPEAGVPGLVGLRDYVWRRIGLRPQNNLSSLGFSEPAAVWHSPQSLPVAKAFDYPPRRLRIDARQFEVDGKAAGDSAIVVANRALDYGPFRVVQARADGDAVAPAWTDQATVIFLAPRNRRRSGEVAWTIRIDAAPDYVDVLTLSGTQAPGAAH
jgi:hypothetical protein